MIALTHPMISRADLIALCCHPLAPSVEVEAIQGKVEIVADGSLKVFFSLHGNLDRLRIPTPQPPRHVDGLWQHTCFEVFVAVEGDMAYREFNFSPSGQWASYGFRDYRQRDENGPPLPTLPVTSRRVDDVLELEARIPRGALPSARMLQVGLSAVIEEMGGKLSYWALRHPEARPDFHHRQGFALQLAQTGATV